MALFPSKELLLVFIFSNALIRFGSSLVIYDYRIDIYNGSGNTSLVTQCVTNGDPVATTTIKPKNLQSFRCPWIVERKRSFATCDLSLGKLHGRFDLFDSDRDLKRCEEQACPWDVSELGLYFGDQLVYRWP